MRSQPLLAAAFVLAAVPVFAQEDNVHHHNLALGFGPAIPAGNSTTYLGSAPLVAFRYGYRFNRYMQADAGLQLAWGLPTTKTPCSRTSAAFKAARRGAESKSIDFAQSVQCRMRLRSDLSRGVATSDPSRLEWAI